MGIYGIIFYAMANKIKYFEILDSTNQYVMRNVFILDHLSVVVAHKQKQGRGKLGRIWKSDQASNLYMSILLKDEPRLPAVIHQLTLFASLITTDCISRHIDSSLHLINIRWPNDVLVDKKKIAGILAESSWQGNDLLYAVLGVGLNINMSQEELDQIDQPATSLNWYALSHIDKEDVLHSWLKIFSATWEKFLADGLDQEKLEHYITGQPDSTKDSKSDNNEQAEKKYSNYTQIIEGRTC